MKKFTTKKLAIAFVAIAFLFIFGFTAVRGLTGQFQSHPEVVREVKKSTRKKTASTSKKTESKEETNPSLNKQDTKSSEASSKQDTKSSDTSSKQETKPSVSSNKQDTSTKQQTSTPQHVETPRQETPVKQTVSIQVIGINTTMMQGNIEVNSSSTAYSVLKELAKQNGKSISTKGFGSTVYVSGIDGLNEFDHGPSSGWMYKVNGTPPNIGAGAYKVKAGDTVIWYYVNAQ